MTIYHVAYPNSSLRPTDRVCRCRAGPLTKWKDLISQLCEQYLNKIEDLRLATLWKASRLSWTDVDNASTQIVYDWIRSQAQSTPIARTAVIEGHFPSGPAERSDKQVDIVVVTPEIEESMQGCAPHEIRYMKVREKILRGIKLAPLPPESVKSPAITKETVLGSSGPRYGRPSDRFGPPTALYSKPLARLKHNLEHLESFKPEPEMLDHALDLIDVASNFFTDEKERELLLQHILGKLLVGKSPWQESIADNTPKPDAVWLEGPFAYMIAELKSESGLGGDPSLRGLVLYGKVIAQDKYAQYIDRSNLPVILLAIAGNRLVVSAAIFTNAIYADELQSIRLHLGHHGSDCVLRVARVFMAIDESAELLSRQYRALLDFPRSLTSPLWPNPTPANPAESLPELEFFAKINRDDGTKLATIDPANERHGMYLARMQIGTATQDVFVKFAARYHEDAHRLLAAQHPPLAPALHFCKRIIGDMYMVIMEYIPKSRGRPLSSLLPRQFSSEAVDLGLTKALNLLHEQDLVFGDLRETNVLYLPEGEGRVLLVDFDGVGQDGVDRYSASLNAKAGLGVKKWQIMEKSHDEENLRRLMERLSARAPQ